MLWWRAARPYAYPASVVPVLLGAALAFADGISVSLWRLLLTLVGIVAAHAGGNLMNDYFDFRKGVDRPGTLGGSGALVDGLMTPRKVLFGAVISFAAAAAAGLPL
ncbi:MAG TPA: prenyltransferase, partial [bacterium]|nr:prenyltransferase [bacterium]